MLPGFLEYLFHNLQKPTNRLDGRAFYSDLERSPHAIDVITTDGIAQCIQVSTVPFGRLKHSQQFLEGLLFRRQLGYVQVQYLPLGC